MNSIKDHHRKLDEWVLKAEQVLAENFTVIGKLLVPVVSEKEE